MATQLTADDARQSLGAHVAEKGMEILTQYGPKMGWRTLQLLLENRAFVRYPCEIVFDAAPLRAGEFAFPVPRGENPEAGFSIYVHPLYMLDLEHVPYLVLYQLVAVNYGAFASGDDAEIFGASALGLDREEYYKILCGLADQLGASELVESSAHGCGDDGSCHCG